MSNPLQVVLKAPSETTFATDDARQRFAEFVADILAAGRDEFTPYELNEGRSNAREFTVDAHNDWWVFFDGCDPKLVRIQQRYGVREELEPLAAYVAHRWGASVVQGEVALA